MSRRRRPEKREILPELDDEFVASLDEEGITTAAELEARVRGSGRPGWSARTGWFRCRD